MAPIHLYIITAGYPHKTIVKYVSLGAVTLAKICIYINALYLCWYRKTIYSNKFQINMVAAL